MQQRKKENYNGIKIGLWYTLGNILIKGIPFFSLPIFTRLLSTTDFGVYNIYIAYEGILNIIVGLGISGTVKTAFIDFREEFEKYISSSLKLIIIMGAVVLLVGNIAASFIKMHDWLTRYTLTLLILQSLSTAVYGVVSTKYVITREYTKNLITAFSVAVLNIGISIVLCLFFQDAALARITGTAIGSITIAIILLIAQKKNYPFIFQKKENLYSLKLGIPLIPHQLSLIIMGQCDKLMIQKLVGNSEAGIYSLALNIVTILTVILSSIDSAWAPWYYNSLANKKFYEIKKINDDLLAFFMYLTSGFILIGADIIHIMAEKSYWESIYVFIPLAVSVFFNFMYLYDVNLEYFNKQTYYISYASVICALLNIILNFIFINIGGYIAASYATCLAKLILFMMHHIRVKKLKTEKVVHERYLLVTASIVIIIAVMTNVLLDRIFIRYLIIIIMTVLITFYFYKYNYFQKLKIKLKKTYKS